MSQLPQSTRTGPRGAQVGRGQRLQLHVSWVGDWVGTGSLARVSAEVESGAVLCGVQGGGEADACAVCGGEDWYVYLYIHLSTHTRLSISRSLSIPF